MVRARPATALVPWVRKAASGVATKAWVPWVLGALVIAFGYTLCRRSIILSDEGYLLLQSLDMARGMVLYRDMDSFVAPGVWFLLAGLFKVVEPSVFATRLLALACYASTVWVGARIVHRVAGRGYAWGAVGAFVVFAVWAFPAWTWSFYSPYSILFALCALDRLLAWRESEGLADLVGIGAFLGLSVLFKQNYGVLALAGVLLGIVAIRLELRPSPRALFRALPAMGWPMAVGVAAAGLPFLAYFAHHGALGHAFDALVLHPFGGFLGQHDIAFLSPAEFLGRSRMAGAGRLTYGSFAFNNAAMRYAWPHLLVRGVENLHVLLYWLPPLIFALAGALMVTGRRGARRVDGALAAVLAVAVFLFLGVFPRADYNHLVNVIQPVIVLAAIAAQRLASRIGAGARRRWVGVLAGGLLLPYLGIAAYWYVDLLSSMTEEVSPRRGGVLVSPEAKQMLDFEVEAIRASTRTQDKVLTLPGFAMLNFLAERSVPSRYYNLYAVHIAHDQGRGVVESSEANRVQLVVADYYDFFSDRVGLREYAPKLADYLRRNFSPVFSVAVDEHLFLRRRPAPLPDTSTLEVLAECDAGRLPWKRRGVMEHLLFGSLYHAHQPAGQRPVRPSVETLCRVRLPEAARLRFSVAYRQPTRVSPGTSFTSAVWVFRPHEPGEGGERVYEESFQPVEATGWASPPPVERVVDLSRWSGEEVLLLFRSRFDGEVRMNLLDAKGFAVAWHGPLIEYDPRDADASASGFSADTRVRSYSR